METREIRLNEVARIAVRLDQATGCPAQLLIAQWAVESKWGEKPVGHAKYFGVKRAARIDCNPAANFTLKGRPAMVVHTCIFRRRRLGIPRLLRSAFRRKSDHFTRKSPASSSSLWRQGKIDVEIRAETAGRTAQSGRRQ
jgi:hypothetical protein